MSQQNLNSLNKKNFSRVSHQINFKNKKPEFRQNSQKVLIPVQDRKIVLNEEKYFDSKGYTNFNKNF